MEPGIFSTKIYRFLTSSAFRNGLKWAVNKRFSRRHWPSLGAEETQWNPWKSLRIKEFAFAAG